MAILVDLKSDEFFHFYIVVLAEELKKPEHPV